MERGHNLVEVAKNLKKEVLGLQMFGLLWDRVQYCGILSSSTLPQAHA